MKKGIITYSIKEVMRLKVLDHGWEHVDKGHGGVDAEEQVVDKDERGHGRTGLGLFCWFGVHRSGNHPRDLADLGVEESDADTIRSGDTERSLPVHEKVVVFRKGNSCRPGSCVKVGEHYD